MKHHYRYKVWLECEREDMETGEFVDGAALGLLPDCLGSFKSRRGNEACERAEREATMAVQHLIQLLNSGHWKQVESAVKHVIAHEHHTLMQLFVRLVLLPAMQTVAEPRLDARNQASVDICKRMLVSVPEDERYFPYI